MALGTDSLVSKLGLEGLMLHVSTLAHMCKSILLFSCFHQVM